MVCASESLLPAITLRVGSQFKLFGVIPTLNKSCLVDRYSVPSATKTTSSLEQNSRTCEQDPSHSHPALARDAGDISHSPTPGTPVLCLRDRAGWRELLSLVSRHCAASLSGMSCSLAQGHRWGGSAQQTGVGHAGRLRRPFSVQTSGAPQPRRCPGEAGQSRPESHQTPPPRPPGTAGSPARTAGNRLLERPILKSGADHRSTVLPHTRVPIHGPQP